MNAFLDIKEEQILFIGVIGGLLCDHFLKEYFEWGGVVYNKKRGLFEDSKGLLIRRQEVVGKGADISLCGAFVDFPAVGHVAIGEYKGTFAFGDGKLLIGIVVGSVTGDEGNFVEVPAAIDGGGSQGIGCQGL